MGLCVVGGIGGDTLDVLDVFEEQRDLHDRKRPSIPVLNTRLFTFQRETEPLTESLLARMDAV